MTNSAGQPETRPRAVLWDMDGTLADSGEPHWHAWRAAMSAVNRTLTRAQFDAARVLFLDLNDDEGAERAESAISAYGSAWSPASGAAYRGREHRRQGGNPQ